MGDTFIGSYCKLADGEKDPRNLLIAYSIARVIVVEFEIDNLVDVSFDDCVALPVFLYRWNSELTDGLNSVSSIQELFDITFCYFPITYKPPPKDPYGISTEDLRVALR